MIRLLWRSVRHHWGMQLATVFVIFVSVSLLFATWLLQQGMRNGLEREQERLGADLLVVPDGVTVEPGEILYGGAPQNIYMPKEAAAEIQSVPGVEGVSVQFFSQTLQADCCDFGDPLRLVGIDPQTDGLAAAWSHDGTTSQLQADEIFTGSQVAAKPGQHFFILGRMFRVAGVLEPSGSGLDKSILMDLSVARELASQAPQLRGALQEQGGADQLISAVLVILILQRMLRLCGLRLPTGGMYRCFRQWRQSKGSIGTYMASCYCWQELQGLLHLWLYCSSEPGCMQKWASGRQYLVCILHWGLHLHSLLVW